MVLNDVSEMSDVLHVIVCLFCDFVCKVKKLSHIFQNCVWLSILKKKQ